MNSDPTTTRTSLDDVFAEIQRESAPLPPMTSAGSAAPSVNGLSIGISAGANDISAHLTTSPVQHQPAMGQTDLWESALTPRQQGLPKIHFKMLGSIVAVFVFVIGLSSVTYLTQQSQDVRQQAYEDVLPDLQNAPATATTEETMQEEAQTGMFAKSPLSSFWLGVAAITLSAVGVIGLLYWLFAD